MKNSKTVLKNEDYLVLLQALFGFSPKHFKISLQFNLTPKDVWESSISKLNKYFGINFAKKLSEQRNKINPNEELGKIREKSNFITILGPSYPDTLREIFSSPLVLYYFGNIDLLRGDIISIVGNRKISPYGKTVTQEIASTLSKAGLSIASGLALGVDSLAHEYSLSGNGKTIAILGNGLDKIYPVSNTQLARNIVKEKGLILSEFSPFVPPLKQNFPARNRIIAGVSKGLIVTEAGLSSGSLITAALAIDQGKDVFAVPGPIYSPNSKGTNQLIKMGANLITCGQDILDFYGYTETPKEQIRFEGEQEIMIYNILVTGQKHIDDMIKESGKESQVVISALTLMEIKGKVKNLGGMNYSL